jgi:hypothetical protein
MHVKGLFYWKCDREELVSGITRRLSQMDGKKSLLVLCNYWLGPINDGFEFSLRITSMSHCKLPCPDGK